MASLSVLIVDDEPLARDRLRALLDQEADVRILGECAGGRTAVKAIQEKQPDLVFLDVQMPTLDGFGVVKQVGAERMIGGVSEYVVGNLVQKTVSVATRGNFTFSPTLTFQLYAEPFMSSGKYVTYKRVTDPSGRNEATRFDVLGVDRIIRDGTRISADFDRDGTADLDLGTPDFTFLSLRSTAVLRWEYRPASTVFLVWQQERGRQLADGRFRLGSNLGSLFGAEASNALILKVSYWGSIR